jgi:hypothetical protein
MKAASGKTGEKTMCKRRLEERLTSQHAVKARILKSSIV